MKRLFRPISFVGGFAAFAAVIVAASLSTATPAQYIIAHVSPNSPDMDVYVDGVLQEASIAYGEVGTLRSAGHSGNVTVSVTLAGTKPDSGTILIADVNLRPGATYLITVSNFLEYLQIGHYPIDPANLSSTAARVQVLHALPGGPRMSIKAGGDLLVANELGYLEDPTFVDVSPGEYHLSGLVNGSPNPAFDRTQFLEAGTVYTVIVTGPPLDTIVLPVRFAAAASAPLVQSSQAGSSDQNCAAYTVKKGDYLFLIALKFKTTAKAIADLNNISNPNLVRPGQVLQIPCDSSGGPALPPSANATEPQKESPADSPDGPEPGETVTPVPTEEPTVEPSDTPAPAPTDPPAPTEAPTDSPAPTEEPTSSPEPTSEPTDPPTPVPTDPPTAIPTDPPTDTPEPPGDNLFFYAGFETGDLSEFTSGDRGDWVGRSESWYDITTQQAHTGSYSGAITIDTSGGEQAGYFFYWKQDLPADATYSAWYFIPGNIQPGNWWNIMQWKGTDSDSSSSDPMFVIDGAYGKLALIYRADSDSLKQTWKSNVDLPRDRWFNLEARYISDPANGSITVWLDGQQIFNVSGYPTRLSKNLLYWSVNNYAEAILPQPATIYVDDLAIRR